MDRGKLYIPDARIGKLLDHPHPEVRLAALSLLVTSASATRAFTEGTFKCLKHALPHLFADTDANFRGETLSLLQRLIDRLRDSMSSLSRNINRSKPNGTASEKSTDTQDLGCAKAVLQRHVDFLGFLIRFVKLELRPTASYQRRITSLKFLAIIMQSGLDSSVPHEFLSRQARGEIKWPFHIQVVDTWLRRMLLELVMDPFEDVRYLAASLLETSNYDASTIPNGQQEHKILRTALLCSKSTSLACTDKAISFVFNHRAERIMLRTGRADHADGVAHAYKLLYSQLGTRQWKDEHAASFRAPQWCLSQSALLEHLVCQLEETVSTAKRSLSSAVNGFPIHGTLSSLR